MDEDEDEKDEDENEDADEKLKKYYRPQSLKKYYRHKVKTTKQTPPRPTYPNTVPVEAWVAGSGDIAHDIQPQDRAPRCIVSFFDAKL